MRVLVTGAGGFVGRHLVRELARRGHMVFAGMHVGTAGTEGISEYAEDVRGGQVSPVAVDITDGQALAAVLARLRPDGIIHLAAQSMVKKAWQDPAQTLLVNSVGTVLLLQAVQQVDARIKLMTVGSSEEYGLAGKDGRPVDEEKPCLPQNPYAVSKLAAGLVTQQLARRDGIWAAHVRPFNHFGPGQRMGFVVSDFAAQIAGIEKGLFPPVMKVGDLSARRDFTDVRDVVQAYALLLERDVAPGIYNVCSGQARSANEILMGLLALTKQKVTVEVDTARFRPSEVPVFVGSGGKIRQAVGWQPARDLDASLRETLDWWRGMV